ncbi:MAG TPA: L-threonylcarbamoyladenylate synthase [Nocardioidaceae bacterium]|nr:L-threonylcarbamoyladenylate synthase [Nocardioidaceae bacterium]
MATVLRCIDEPEREAGLQAAVEAVRRGSLVVFPTDTVYGVGADAFDPESVRLLLRAKGRGRDMPPPVLVSSVATLDALATDLGDDVRVLVEACWPGPLTLVCRQQPSLRWDLGDTRGTVAVRMPDHDLALALLERTGPLAVSSANRSGEHPASSAAEAQGMLAEAVEVYLDGGTLPPRRPSTIVDVTGDQPRVLRTGALQLAKLQALVPAVTGPV